MSRHLLHIDLILASVVIIDSDVTDATIQTRQDEVGEGWRQSLGCLLLAMPVLGGVTVGCRVTVTQLVQTIV